MKEIYTVKFQHRIGKFVEIISEDVGIEITGKEKCSHEKACRIIENKYKEVKIFNCTYN